MRLHQPHLRVLRRVQAAVQHPVVEDLHGLLQLLAGVRADRREGAGVCACWFFKGGGVSRWAGQPFAVQERRRSKAAEPSNPPTPPHPLSTRPSH